MALYFKCPHCKAYVVSEQGELLIDIEEGTYICPECGGIMKDNRDIVEYNKELFYRHNLM